MFQDFNLPKAALDSQILGSAKGQELNFLFGLINPCFEYHIFLNLTLENPRFLLYSKNLNVYVNKRSNGILILNFPFS